MRTPNSWYTACESLEKNWRPLPGRMVRGYTHRNVFVDQNVDRTLSGELGGIDGEHIGPTTETVGDQQDVAVASRRDRERAEVVDTDGDARTFRERHGDDWPTDSQSRGFPRLALQAVAKPPPGAHVHVNPPVKPLQRAQGARGAKVARSRRMASLHDPRAHE